MIMHCNGCGDSNDHLEGHMIIGHQALWTHKGAMPVVICRTCGNVRVEVECPAFGELCRILDVHKRKEPEDAKQG